MPSKCPATNYPIWPKTTGAKHQFFKPLKLAKTMENKKISLANVQGKLSRAEMKNVMAGEQSGVMQCAWTNHSGITHYGNCTGTQHQCQTTADQICRANPAGCDYVECRYGPLSNLTKSGN
jgi:hypothetical protein